MKSISVGLLVLTLTCGVTSQASLTTLRGRVIDLLGNGIEGASVTVRDSTGVATTRTITDKQGDFGLKLTLASMGSVSIEASGFSRRQLPITDFFVGNNKEPRVIALELGRIGLSNAGVINGKVLVNRRLNRPIQIRLISAYDPGLEVSTYATRRNEYSIEVANPGVYILFAIPNSSTICARGVSVKPTVAQKKYSVDLDCH